MACQSCCFETPGCSCRGISGNVILHTHAEYLWFLCHAAQALARFAPAHEDDTLAEIRRTATSGYTFLYQTPRHQQNHLNLSGYRPYLINPFAATTPPEVLSHPSYD